MQLTSRLCESRVGDRKLLARLVEIRQHVVTLSELRVKLDTARGDYLQTTWDGASLRVRQVIDKKKGCFFRRLSDRRLAVCITFVLLRGIIRAFAPKVELPAGRVSKTLEDSTRRHHAGVCAPLPWPDPCLIVA